MTSDVSLEQVVDLHLAGDLAGAERGYRILIGCSQPGPVVYGNLALICLATGRTEEAIELLQQSLKLYPDRSDTYLNLGVACKDLDRLEIAEASFRKAIELNPLYPEAQNNLGMIFLGQGKLEEAMSCFCAALKLSPDYPEAHNNLGLTLLGQQKFEQATSSFLKALELNPISSAAHNNRGMALLGLGKPEEAIVSLNKAIELNPDYYQAHFNLGCALQECGRLEDAIWSHRKALKLHPDYPEANLQLGHIARANSQLDRAISNYRKALDLRPDFAEAHYYLGITFLANYKMAEAASCFRKVIELNPDHVKSHYLLGFALKEHGDLDAGIAFYRKALEIRSANFKASDAVRELGHALLELDRIPAIYKDAAEVDACRSRYISCLHEASMLAENTLNTLSEVERSILQEVLFLVTNFYVGYQQLNDKEPQIAYSKLATRILRPEIDEYLEPNRVPRSDQKIRLGVASAFLGEHNGCFWAYNWLAHLPKKDYQFFLYSLNGMTDDVTRKFASLGTFRRLPFEETSYQQSLQVIKEDKLDVLLIPDVGMTARNRILSLARLAPIQCVGWGHPVTTGSPNIDYYLSGELIETTESDGHYSEQLVRLPNVGINFDTLQQPSRALTAGDFGIPNNKIVYGSLQSIFKYLPQFDFVYPAIARQVPDALFVFVDNVANNATAPFRERLKKTFEQSGLRFEKHVKFLPRMPFPRFQQLLRVIDINLDSIGWSGGITTMHSLGMDCPVITLPREYMRGRFSYGLLKMMGVEELIATSFDEYISIAVKIGLDKNLRSTIVDKIRSRKHKIFNDMECSKYLDSFFKSKVSEHYCQYVGEALSATSTSYGGT